MARMSTMSPHPNQHRNLILGAILGLAQFGLHFRDSDVTIITISLQQLHHGTSDYIILGQPLPTPSTTSNIPFTIIGNNVGTLPFVHKQDLHLWLEAVIPFYSVNQHHNHLSAPSPLLYELPECLSTIEQAIICYQGTAGDNWNG